MKKVHFKEEKNMNKPGGIEYKMSGVIADNLLNSRKGEDKKMNPAEYLCKVVNEEYRLKEKCISILLF